MLFNVALKQLFDVSLEEEASKADQSDRGSAKSLSSVRSEQVITMSEIDKMSSVHGSEARGSEQLGSEKPSSGKPPSVISSARVQSAKSGSTSEMFRESPSMQKTGMLSHLAVMIFLIHIEHHYSSGKH